VVNWEIPPSLAAADLRERLALLKKHTDEPPVYEDGRTAEDFLRRKTKPRADRLESSDEDGEGDDDDSVTDRETIDGEPQFGPNVLKAPKPKKGKKLLRRRRRDDGEDPETLRKGPEEAERKLEARRKKQEEKMASIRSEIYIRDSDDEENEERDRVFFERERELAKKRTIMGPAPEEITVTKKRRRRKRKGGDGEDEEEEGGREKESKKRKRTKRRESDDAEDLGKGADKENHDGPLFFSDDGDNDSDEQMQDVNLLGDFNSDDDSPAPVTRTSMSKSMTSQNSKRLDSVSLASTRILPTGSGSETEKDESDDNLDDDPIGDDDDGRESGKENKLVLRDENKGDDDDDDDDDDANDSPVAKPVRNRQRQVLVDSDEG